MASAWTASSDDDMAPGLIPRNGQYSGRGMTAATLLTTLALGSAVLFFVAKPFVQMTRTDQEAIAILFDSGTNSSPSSVGAPPESIFVSGLSSGADFAAQFQVAYSANVSGAAIFAGQPFRCAITRFPKDELQPPNPEVPICVGCPPNTTLIYDHCKHEPSWVDVSELKAVAENNFKDKLIDDPSNLNNTGVYCYRGTEDSHYAPGSVAKTAEFFTQFASSPNNVKLVDDVPSGHAYPLPGTCPWPCGLGATANIIPFQNCRYDGIGEALKHIYSTLGKPIRTLKDWFWDSLFWFDQEPFWGNRNITRLEKYALIYVPKRCASSQNAPLKRCNLMVNFHGCGFVFPGTYEMLVTQLNLNAWAEANDIVVLYPRLGAIGTTAEQKQGCWNVYGQTGVDYATKNADQMAAIWQMVSSLTKLNLVGKFNPSELDASDIECVLKAGLYKTGKAIQKELLVLAKKKLGRAGKMVVKRAEKRVARKVGNGMRKLCHGKLKEKFKDNSQCATDS